MFKNKIHFQSMCLVCFASDEDMIVSGAPQTIRSKVILRMLTVTPINSAFHAVEVFPNAHFHPIIIF